MASTPTGLSFDYLYLWERSLATKPLLSEPMESHSSYPVDLSSTETQILYATVFMS